jgi:hypothetical protein
MSVSDSIYGSVEYSQESYIQKGESLISARLS